MRFCCPSCGQEEEIILDRTPRCRDCGAEMIRESDYSELWMSPYIAIVRMKTISETYGIQRARADGRFKKEREAWTTGVFALALSSLNNDEYWIELETSESTPDTRLQQIDQSSGYNVLNTRNIEVVDWQENIDDIMDVIKRKCERGYPGDYLLLVHARHAGELLDFDRVMRQMKTTSSPFLEVWVIASVGSGQLKVVRVAPGGPALDVNLPVELQRASKQKPFVKRGIRGTTPGFQPLGPGFLPIP